MTDTVAAPTETAGRAVPGHLKPGKFEEPPSPRLEAFMAEGWGGLPDPEAPPAPPAERLRARRDLLRGQLPVPLPAVVPAGRALIDGGRDQAVNDFGSAHGFGIDKCRFARLGRCRYVRMTVKLSQHPAEHSRTAARSAFRHSGPARLMGGARFDA